MTKQDRKERLLIHMLTTTQESKVKIKMQMLDIRIIAEEIRDKDGVNEHEFYRANLIIDICNKLGVG